MNARQRYTELVRHFLSGRITNFKYEIACDALVRDLDEASDKVYCELWYYYSDVREHRMGRERGMTREGRRTAARWIMFLKSNRPFEYRHMIYPYGLISFLTLGFVRKYEYPENTEGDRDYWPYYRKSDFDYDLAHPVYLSGARTQIR
jgi:hypothetical protein